VAELTIDQALQKGVEAHKAGQVQEADRLYTAILKAQPKHPDANHNMGVLAVGVGKVEQALPFFKTALEANPATAQFWLSYIDALIKLEQLADAKAVLDQAKSKGAKGDGFDKLEQQLEEASEEPLAASKTPAEAPPQQPNILDSLKLDQAITLAKKKAKDGSLEEAKRIYQDILTKFPKNKRASDKLKGLAGRPVGKASKGQNPSQDQLQALITLYSQGQLQQALKQAETLVTQFPHSAILFNIQGAVLKGLGQPGLSVEAYSKALAIKPDYAEAYYNMGNALKAQGKLEEAIEAYSKALAIKPDYAEAYSNMGVTLQDQGKLEAAIEAYNKALAIKPDHAEACNNMGNTLKDQDELEKAIDSYNKALAIKPDYVEVWNNMGNALKEQGKLEEAIEAYNKALAIKPDFSDAWSNGAQALEKWNKLKELGLWLERAFQTLDPIPSDISFMKAKLLWRNKDTQEAVKLISNIDVETLKAIRQQDYLNLKAKCYEASKDYNLAFNCFENMNSFAIKSNDYLRLDPERYFQNIKEQLASLKSNSLENPVNNITEQPDLVPVFLVGFPRSGTTLLDTILRSHSSIDVVEEQPAVNLANAFVKKSGYSGLQQTLPHEVLVGARKAYITELDKHREPADNKSILIDKLPLNLVKIPFIQKLYPQAKFILALRHPLDTILSCWMQNFKLNSAMANMVELDRIVEFYCVAMETFKICKAKYNLNVHQIKYEDLVESVSGETSALLKFLDLDWEAQMENYQDTALKRGRINTPSYSQVIQPIYKDAKYRWLNYEKHLRQYITQVEPWINEFGYSNT
jgi:tetratricopeptide (TPR) repeat protein